MAQLSISLLGAFQVNLSGVRVDHFESVKVRALLAYLAVEADQAHRREQLASLLWPDRPEARARRNLSQAVYNLRIVLGDNRGVEQANRERQTSVDPFLLVQSDTLQFNLESDTWVDVAEFIRLLAISDSHPHQRLEDCPACLEQIEAAAALYQGELLRGFALKDCQVFNEWSLIHRERLRRLALNRLENLATCRARRGELDQALAHAWQLTELEPLWEQSQRLLIDLLAKTGQQSAALSQFENYRQALFDELGLLPEAVTESLIERIRREKTTPPFQSNIMHNLPAALTPFVGRKEAMARLNASLHDPDCRLLTITGPGGSGKTRLALEAAKAQIAHYPEGVWRVSLAPLQSASAIPGAIAEAFGLSLKDQPPPVQQLNDYLRAKRLLLVLDGYEHLLAGAGLALELLRGSPGLKILATSRMWLNVYGEQIFTLGGLELPPEKAGLVIARGNEAVELFVTAGKRVRPSLDLAPQNLASVVRICRLVRGNPLGLLLAAAWLDTLSANEVAAELDRSLDFLSATWEDFPPRQRSLRATFEYSWRFLAAEEQKVLSRLAVFLGGFNSQAAAEVAHATHRNLHALVAKSMLERKLTGRFELHDLVRQFAREKLGEKPKDGPAVRESHAAFYLGKLPGWAEALKSPRQDDALEEMDVEIGNVVAAWGWTAEQGLVERLEKGLEGLCRYYDLRVRLLEGQNACQVALDHPPAGPHLPVQRLRRQATTWNARFLSQAGKYEKAVSMLKEALAALENPDSRDPETQADRARIHLELGHAILSDDRQAARGHFHKSLALYEEVGDEWRQAQALGGLGTVAHHTGTFAEAVEFYQRSLALTEASGDPKSIAGVLIELGHNLLRQGHLEQGDGYIRRGCEIYQRIGDRGSLADSLLQLGRVYFWHGNFHESIQLMDEARPIFEELGWNEKMAFTVEGKGICLALIGDYEAALQQGQQGLVVSQDTGFQRYQAVAFWVLGLARLGTEKFRLAEENLQNSVDLYREIEQNDELGWALATLAYAQLELDQEAAFRQRLGEALRQGLEIKGLYTILLALPAAALYHLNQSRTSEEAAAVLLIQRAVELYALARKFPSAGNAQWFEDVAGKKIAAAAAGLPEAEVAAARERGRLQDPFTIARELLDELGL